MAAVPEQPLDSVPTACKPGSWGILAARLPSAPRDVFALRCRKVDSVVPTPQTPLPTLCDAVGEAPRGLSSYAGTGKLFCGLKWRGQDLPGGSACCLVPLSAGREPGTPLLQPPASAPLVHPGCFPSKVCVPQRCVCLLSSLPSFLSPFSSPFSPLSLPSALHESLSSGLCTKAQVPTPLLLDLPLHPGDSGVPSSHVGHGESSGSPPSCRLLLPPSPWDERRGQVPRRCSASQTEGLGHRESHEEGPRVPRSPGGGSETPVESPREQEGVLGELWAH